MIRRCSDPKTLDWPRYGGAGIVVCERWLTFDNFLADMGLKPGLDYSIERENAAKGYEPDNCCWATKRQQNQNRPSFNKLSPMAARVIRRLRQRKMTGKEVAGIFGVNSRTIYKIDSGRLWNDAALAATRGE